MRRGFEVDDDFGETQRQVFAGADVEGHTAPAPVIDLQAQRHVGFGAAVRGDAFFLTVAGNRPAIDFAFAVLGEDEVVLQVFGIKRVQAVQDFRRFVTHGIGIDQRGRLHRHHRQDLQKVVLEHVAHRAGTVVVTAPVFHADGFGGGDFHVVDVVPVPERLEQAVGEAQHQQVLHGFFAEVVVDTVNLVFEEVVVDGCVQLARSLRIVAKGLFHDEPFPAVIFAVQAVRGETGGDDAVETGRGGKIVEGVATGLVFGVQGIKTRHEFAVIIAVGGVERLVIEAGAEIVQRCSACIFLVDEVLPHGVSE